MDNPAHHSEEHLYREKIDAETWAFIEKTAACYPENTVELSIVEQRKIYDTMCYQFHAGYPETVAARDEKIQCLDHAIPIRTYTRKNAVEKALVLFYHGGGFVVGGLESHDDVCAELCDQTGFEVVSVDYRLAPEHVFPSCFDDALSAFQYISHNNPKPVVVVGDSAGGNLAAAVCEATKNGKTKPAGQLLIYPALGPVVGTTSYGRHRAAPMLTSKDVDFYRDIRTGGRDHGSEPTLMPLLAKDVAAIPPTVLFSAEIDPICDDGQLYIERLKGAGVPARWHCETGLVHGYLRARHSVKRAKESFERIVSAISELGRSADSK